MSTVFPLETYGTVFPTGVSTRPHNVIELFNRSGSAINCGAPACLLVTGAVDFGIDATIPAANNLTLFRGVWLPNLDGTLTIPNHQFGLVQTKGLVYNPADGVGLARVLGHASITAAGIVLQFTAGNDYFELGDLIAEEQIISGEAWTTASTALKKVFLR